MKTGVAAVSAQLVAALRSRGHVVDPYPEHAAHDFVWRRRQEPYDLAVYQFGNSSHHDYEWAYALNYPGLVVLHDTHLHHARAAFLLRERRTEDYRAEFAWNHPGTSTDLAELGVAGFDSALYYDWPMVRALVASARLVAVHGNARTELLAELASGETSAADASPYDVSAIRLSLGTPLGRTRVAQARRSIRSRYGIGDEAIVFGCFGGLTPEKRLPQILSAFRAVLPYAPSARLLFGGAPAAHYDLRADIAAHGLEDRATLTGYLERDEDLTDHIAACDATLNLRWPTARETSGPWLQALAAGRPTVITDLVHLSDVPSLDPRSWAVNGSGTARDATAVCIAIDLMDEDHSLRLAMRRLAADAELRDSLGRTAQAWWTRQHSPEGMADDYESVLRQAAQRSDPHVQLPPHMRNRGDRTVQSLLAPFGVRNPIAAGEETSRR
ncbi:MAG: glycosyltransferase family 4 protein [Vicinamibacterales bacterium]